MTIISVTTSVKALVFMISHIEEYGYPPTIREVGKYVGYSSSSSAQKLVDSMRTHGLIHVDKGIARGIRVSEFGRSEIDKLMKVNSEIQ